MTNKLRKTLLQFLVLIFAIVMTVSFGLFATSCGETDEETDEPTEEEELTFSLNYHLKSLSLYETLQLEVEGFDDVTWSSDNAQVVSVQDGLVTANGYGTANVTATVGDVSDTCIINVLDEGKVPSIRVNVDDNGFNLLVDDTYSLDCAVRFNNQTFSDGTFSFKSSDGETVSVDANGLVTAKKYGDAIITVAAEWRDFDPIYLVKEIPVSVIPNLSMALSVEDDVIYTMSGTVEGETYFNETQLSYQILLDGQDITSTANVNWVVSDSKIVAVEGRNVVAQGRGTAEIYYEYVVDDRTYQSLPVIVTVNAPRKTIADLVVYEIGAEDCIPSSLFEGTAYSLKIKAADYTQNAEFTDGNVCIDVDTQSGFTGKEINFTVDTNLYSYSVDVLFVTHEISTADNFVAFLNSYSGNKQNVDANMSNTYYAVLTEDIDLSGKTLPSKSYISDRFFGVFNGMGHVLTNATVNATGGIFGGLQNSTIENFALIGVSITKTYSSYAILAGYAYPGAVVRNVYIKATINQLTFFRGLFYGVDNLNISNVIAELEYGSVNTADNKFAFGISSKGFATAPKQIYAIGNATAYSGVSNGKEESDASANYDAENQDVVYATMADFYAAKKTEITAENGFSEYWKATDSALWFGNTMLYMNSSYLEDTQYVETWNYDADNKKTYTESNRTYESAWAPKEIVTLDVANVLGATPVSVTCGSISYEVVDGKITIDPEAYTNGETYVFTVTCTDAEYYVPITFVSQYIENNEEFREFLKPECGINSLTKGWYAVLAKDLDFSKEINGITEMGMGTRFYGTFDGQGHSISNFTLDQALFGYNFGTIKDVAFINVTQTNSSANAGLSYGAFGAQTGVVSNVYMDITFTKADAARGVINQLYGVNVKNCVFNVQYSDGNTAVTTYAINGDASEATSNLTNVYFLGNADQIQPGDTNKPYATGALAKVVAEGSVVLDSTTGFNSCWRAVKVGNTTTVYFGNNVIDVYQAA